MIEQPEGALAPRIGLKITQGLRLGKGPSPAAVVRDPGQELRSEFDARQDIQPSVLAGEKEFRPQYTSLDLQELENYLGGIQAHTRKLEYDRPEQGYRNKFTGEFIHSLPKGGNPLVDPATGKTFMQGGWGQKQPWPQGGVRLYEPFERQVKETRQVSIEAQRGLLDILGKDVFPASDRITAASMSRQRASDIGDVELLGRRASDAFRAANPDQEALLNLLNADARQGMELGTALDPNMQRTISQSVRAGQAARGFGYGRNDAAEESLAHILEGEDLRGRRRTFASGVVGLNAATSLDPFQAILQRPAVNLAQSGGLVGGAQGQRPGPSLFGSNINVNDIFDSNANAQNAANIAGANNKAATQSANVQAGAALAGTAIVGIAL